MTTQRQKTKVYYSSVVPKARQQSNIDKNLAIRYFNKQKAYQSISVNKSYADGLKYGRNTLAKVNNNVLPPSRITKSDPVKQGVSTRTGRIPANQVNVTTRSTSKNLPYISPCIIDLMFSTLLVQQTRWICHPYVIKMHFVMKHWQCTFRKRTDTVSNNPVQYIKNFFGGKKNETGCPDGANTHTKLGKTATNNYAFANSVVRDVSNDGHTHSVDSKEVFDRNYVHNSCDNVTHISCTRGAENDSNHLNSVVHNSQFGFLPSETLKLYTGDRVYYEQIPDIIATHFMVKKSGYLISFNVVSQLHPT